MSPFYRRCHLYWIRALLLSLTYFCKEYLQIRSYCEVLGVVQRPRISIYESMCGGGWTQFNPSQDLTCSQVYVAPQEVAARLFQFSGPWDTNQVISSWLHERVGLLRKLSRRKTFARLKLSAPTQVGRPDLSEEGWSLVPRLKRNLKWDVYWEIWIYKEAIYYA